MSKGGPRSIERRAALGALAGTALALYARPALSAVATAEEAPLEPNLAIVDPHHHFRDYRDPGDPRERYLPDDLLADIARSGHRVTDSIFLECGLMYRPDGPLELRSLGEVEHVRALAERQRIAPATTCRIAAAIVSKVDLRLGARAAEVLHRHIDAAGGRLRGVRNSIAWDAYPPLAAMGLNKDLLSDTAFREGVRCLAPLGLTLDIWLFHPQLPELTRLARAFPDTTIVLNHLGNPLGIGPYAGREAEVRAAWMQSMADLARCPNVSVKLGGLGPFSSVQTPSAPRATSTRLAAQWRPWIETSIALFGPRRCMFESNYPANAGIASYGTTWNAFKRITARASADEKAWLYSRTAQQTYRLVAPPTA